MSFFFPITLFDKKSSRFSALTLGMGVLIVLLLMMLSGCAKERSYVGVKGSDTMVHLVAQWAEHYAQAEAPSERSQNTLPKTPKQNSTLLNHNVAVTGGGSGTGIAALLNGNTDIAASSRDMKPTERAQAKARGIVLKDYPVALDGIAVVVHPQNPVKTLSMDALYQVFTGEVTNWKAVGGEDAPILVYSRESSSGTFEFFKELVLRKQDFVQTARLLAANSAILEGVSSDRGAIGYVGIGFVEGQQGKVKTLGVQVAQNASPIYPSAQTVANGNYPISRPLYFYASATPRRSVQAFIQYCLSDTGQHIVLENGYIPIPKTAHQVTSSLLPSTQQAGGAPQ